MSTTHKIVRVCGHTLSTYLFTVRDMNGPNFTIFDDYLALMARERHTELLDNAAQRRAARLGRGDSTRTRSRFLRWHH